MHRLLAAALGLMAMVGWDGVMAQPSPGPSVKATIADVAWIAGTWTGGDGELRTEERWTPPGGGAMLAVSRTVKGERMMAFEYLRIVERDGTLIYIAQPNGRPPVEFRLTRLEQALALFENPAHDFPKMIRYAKRQDGALEATVSGAGGERAHSFVFRSHK
jgi:hypothetical protein